MNKSIYDFKQLMITVKGLTTGHSTAMQLVWIVNTQVSPSPVYQWVSE